MYFVALNDTSELINRHLVSIHGIITFWGTHFHIQHDGEIDEIMFGPRWVYLNWFPYVLSITHRSTSRHFGISNFFGFASIIPELSFTRDQRLAPLQVQEVPWAHVSLSIYWSRMWLTHLRGIGSSCEVLRLLGILFSCYHNHSSAFTRPWFLLGGAHAW